VKPICRLVLAAACVWVVLTAIAPRAEAQYYDRAVSGVLYYYKLSDDFDDWTGVRLWGLERKSDTFASMAELVVEKRGSGGGGVGQYFFYKDFNRHLFLFGTIGLGAGKEFFTRNKLYAEFNWKIPLFPNLVTVFGFGRNGYGSTYDLQPTLGLTMYTHFLILQIRWFNFINSKDDINNSSYFARVDLNRFGPLDIGVQYLVGGDGYRLASTSTDPELAQFDSRVFTIDTILWTKRDKTGFKIRAEAAQRVDVYDRTGLEFGPIVHF
jgi:YaiO family outer membrane protein